MFRHCCIALTVLLLAVLLLADTPKGCKLRGPVVLAKGDAAQTRKPGEVVEVDVGKGVKMTLCWIPPGKATLGSPEGEKERDKDETEHEYTSKGFWLGKYPVTQEEWQTLIGKNPSWFVPAQATIKKADIDDTSRFPVEKLSWDDCQKFLEKLNDREMPAALGKGKFVLPHEDEWEYACRGGKGNKRPFYTSRGQE